MHEEGRHANAKDIAHYTALEGVDSPFEVDDETLVGEQSELPGKSDEL